MAYIRKLWYDIGRLGISIIDNKNLPTLQLSPYHFDIFFKTAISISGIGAFPGDELLYQSDCHVV
jgi:hypothetical protein